MNDKIELISTDLLKEQPGLSTELMDMSHALALSSGWHYAMDWTWVVSHMDNLAGKKIVDAGAGIGLLQWYLASKGAHVISVDRSDRTCIPFHLLEKFHVSGYTPNSEPLKLPEILNIGNRKAKLTTRAKAIIRGLAGKLGSAKNKDEMNGSIQMYNQDLCDLSAIPDKSIDVVISISALEHNEKIENIKDIIRELERILIPGGKMLVTLPATYKEDWFFSPAYQWCFSEKTLRHLFGFSEDIPSNFDEYEALFEKLAGSDELKRSISWRYFIQPNSGMPWGRWKPQYLPVGIIKTKQA